MITLEQLQQKLSDLVNKPDLINNSMLVGVTSVKALMSERIFQKGGAVNGQIGTYNNTDEMWVPDSKLPKNGSHKGKPNTDGKRKTIKTTYYESYAHLRSEAGRESGFVNLRLQNRLQNDFNNAPVKKADFVYTINVSSLSKKKIEGNEARFNKKIFGLTEDEKKKYAKVVAFEVTSNLFK